MHRSCLGCGRIIPQGQGPRCVDCLGVAYSASLLQPGKGSTRAWRGLRAALLAAEPFCRVCRNEGRHTVAVTIDHIVLRVHGGSDHPSNLQPLCREHHEAKHRVGGGRVAQKPHRCSDSRRQQEP